MCYNIQQKASTRVLTERFNASFKLPELYTSREMINAFSFPELPLLTNEDQEEFSFYHWGLIPDWAEDTGIRKNTLNAKLETMNEKPSFKNYTSNRCILPVTGFYEWKWLDAKGKRKEKYLIRLEKAEVFALAGLFNNWKHPNEDQTINTFTLLTTKADAIMETIHNTKKRMPLIMDTNQAEQYLQDGTIELNHALHPECVESDGQLDLF